MRRTLLIALMAPLFAVMALAGEPEIDAESGLIIAPGFEVVKANCTVCHSARFITTAGYSRKVWLEQIRWMQKDQGLWEFEPEVEKTILDYLETNYPQR